MYIENFTLILSIFFIKVGSLVKLYSFPKKSISMKFLPLFLSISFSCLSNLFLDKIQDFSNLGSYLSVLINAKSWVLYSGSYYY